jgi:hypothetical protein
MSRKLVIPLFVIALLALLTIAMVNARSQALKAPASDNALSDYWQRHPSIRVVGSGNSIDPRDADWFQRHQQSLMIFAAGRSVDYAARHPGMGLAAARSADTTDYYFRHTDR